MVVLCTVFSGVNMESEEFDLSQCKQRESHWRNNQHNYLYSGLLDKVNFPLCSLEVKLDIKEPRKLDWSEARKFCRERCMDLISLETEYEHRLLKRKMKQLGMRSVWTSGHLCDRQVSER